MFWTFKVRFSDQPMRVRVISIYSATWDEAREKVFDQAWTEGDVDLVEFFGEGDEDISVDRIATSSGLAPEDAVFLEMVRSWDKTQH
jgi:hypothetical protein